MKRSTDSHRYARRGTGSARKRNGRWEVRRVIAGESRPFRADTLAEAQALAEKAAHDALLAVKEQSLAPTVRDWLAEWLARKRDELRPQTWFAYELHARRWIVPTIGTVRLDQITPAHVDKLHGTLLRAVSEKTSRKLSSTTIRHVHLTLVTALNDAVKRNVLAANPLRAVAAPRRDDRQIETLTRDEVDSLVSACRDDPFQAAYVLAVTLGMREGELLGLRWDAIDLQRRRLEVRGNATRALDGARHITAPKTRAGNRTLRLPEIAVDALARTPRQGDLVWPSSSGGPIPASSFVSAWEAMRKRAGIRPLHFHALRHTAATLALQDGIQPHDVAAMLGHSTVATTLRLYAHVTDRSTEALVDAIDARYGPHLRVVPGSAI
jgi:integrase